MTKFSCWNLFSWKKNSNLFIYQLLPYNFRSVEYQRFRYRSCLVFLGEVSVSKLERILSLVGLGLGCMYLLGHFDSIIVRFFGVLAAGSFW